MPSKLRSYRPSHATVIAYLALFVALGGSSYAALRVTSRNVPKDALTGADIKKLTGRDVINNSLTGADVKSLGSGDVANGGLLAEDFAPGQLPRGEKGDRGAPGGSGATSVVFRWTTCQNTLNCTARCELGERVVGGGYKGVNVPSQTTHDAAIDASDSVATTGVPDGWKVSLADVDSAFSAQAICVAP